MSREFLPLAVESWVPKVIAGVLAAVLLAGASIMGAIGFGDARVVYTVGGGRLEIRSGSPLDGGMGFPLSAISQARAVRLSAWRRERGTAVPGYCAGRFWSPETGQIWQATDCSRQGVLLTVASEALPIFLTPPDPAGFLAILKAPRDATIELPRGDIGLLRAVAGGVALVLLLSTAFMVAVFLLAPKRLSYAVGGGRLEVRTLLRRRSWPAGQLAVRPYAPAAVLRLMGTSFPGYHTGLFREQGRNLRVYATDLRRGVLIEGPQRVYLSPADRDGFLAALRDEGARIEDSIGA